MRRTAAACRPLLGLALCAVASACGRSSPPPAGIVLITLDTTRADHIGCYGDAQALTPNLDALAKEGVRFDQAVAAVPQTLPSHATIFTGMFPPAHGVRYNGMFKLGEGSVTIAQRLRGAGFATGAVPAAYPVYAKSGLDRGFDTYRDLFSEPGAEKLPLAAERSAEEVTRLGLEAIRSAGTKPFFVWLHYYDAHYPYTPPFPFSSRFREHPYDGEIASIDAQLGELFRDLRVRGLWGRIAIVVVGDHGEGLYEHNERMHSQLAYESTLRVPFLVKTPGAKAGLVIHEPVTLADLAPTILDVAGLPVPGGLDGISLKRALGGQEPPRRALYFETLAGSLMFGWSPIEGVRRGSWKLLRSSDPELYDLAADPAEASNVFSSEASVASDLGATLDQKLAQWTAHAAPALANTAPLDPAAVARLASLGYIGGDVSTVSRGGPNPRSMAHLEGELLLLQDLMNDRQYRNALVSTANILRDDPGNRFALNAAADASAGVGDYAAAKRYGRELIARYPEYVPGVVAQGRLAFSLKDYKSAEAFLRGGLQRSPAEPSLVYALALTLVAEGRSVEAQPMVEKALEAKGADPAFRVLLALCRAIAGDRAGAKTELARAIADGFDNEATIRREPAFAPLRKVPGFDDALKLIPKKGA